MAATRLQFENRHLRLEIDVEHIAFHVTERATGVVWRMAGPADDDIALRDSHGAGRTCALADSTAKVVLPARDGLPGAYIRLDDLGIGVQVILDARDVVVEIDRLYGCGPLHVRDVLFPRHFQLPKESGAYSTWTVGQGSIVPATTHARFHHPEGYSEQEMAWHGAFAGGCGMVAIAETPFDMYVAMSHREREAPSTFIRWLPSLGDLRYTRRVRYTFAKGLDFVAQAKAYRRHMQRQGYFITLQEKARRNRNVARLRGAVVVNSMTAIRRVRTHAYELNRFADQAQWMLDLRKRSGIENAVMHVDGWGRFGYDSVHPETLPPNVEAGGAGALRAFREQARDIGWLFGLHDQYIDIYADAPSWDPAKFLIKENGSPNILNAWAGGKCAHLCYRESLAFVRRNYIDGVRDQYMYHNSPPIFAVCDPDASYLDCFCRINECFNPTHPMTRSESVHLTRECLRTVREHGAGVVQSCEHPKFYAVPDLDFGWGIGHLKADVHVVGGGSATEMIGIPVPLWHLVFHDAVWLPEYSTDYGQMLLYASSAYLQNSKAGPGEEELRWKRKVAALNVVAGFDEMTGFSVSADGTLFSSTFTSGVRVTLDRGERTYRIQGPRDVATKGFERLP